MYQHTNTGNKILAKLLQNLITNVIYLAHKLIFRKATWRKWPLKSLNH